MANNSKWTVVDLTTVEDARKEKDGKYLRFRCPVCGKKPGHEHRRDARILLSSGFGQCYSGSCEALFISKEKFDEQEKERKENQEQISLRHAGIPLRTCRFWHRCFLIQCTFPVT